MPGQAPLVHPDCEIAGSRFGSHVEIGRGGGSASHVTGTVRRDDPSAA